MSECAMIRSSIKANNRGFLHTDGEKSGENPFFTCAKIIKFFEMFGAIVNGLQCSRFL